MASYFRNHPFQDGWCEWGGSQCSSSLNGRRHSYSIDLFRRNFYSYKMETTFLMEIEDAATSTLVEVEEGLDSQKSPQNI